MWDVAERGWGAQSHQPLHLWAPNSYLQQRAVGSDGEQRPKAQLLLPPAQRCAAAGRPSHRRHHVHQKALGRGLGPPG